MKSNCPKNQFGICGWMGHEKCITYVGVILIWKQCHLQVYQSTDQSIQTSS